MKEHICEKCEHEKECRNMVCFYELIEKEEEKIRADELRKVILKLSESEETILSDKQYYVLMELKEQKNE